MTKKNFFTCDNPIMFDWENGRCRCIPIPYKEDKMTEKPKKTPEKELECPKKYVYDTGIIFECKENSRVEIIGEDVVGLLNELTTKCSKLEKENEKLKYTVSAYMIDLNNYKGKCSRLEEENELLEKKLKCITESLQNELNASLR